VYLKPLFFYFKTADLLQSRGLFFIMLAVISFLNSCAAINYDNCPVYPIAGENVGKELENIPYSGYENFWEWLARINKLKEELDLCKG